MHGGLSENNFIGSEIINDKEYGNVARILILTTIILEERHGVHKRLAILDEILSVALLMEKQQKSV